MIAFAADALHLGRRSPHGERGLKYELMHWRHGDAASLSSWRAWIEIVMVPASRHGERSLSSWRAWIEITICVIHRWNRTRRSPHGERGLKYIVPYPVRFCNRVALLMESVD